MLPTYTPCSTGSPRLRRGLLACCVAAFGVAFASPAAADSLVIERPGAHPRYAFELEPHLLVGFIDPPGPGNGAGLGFGVRGTIPIVQNGFIKSINNSVGIGFGLDFAHYGSTRGRCNRFDLMGVCQDYVEDRSVDAFWVPVVMQWNFWLSRNWSVFGEPGFSFRFDSHNGGDRHVQFDPLHMYAGGRFHFSDKVTLTMRVGYPTFSIGASFLL